MKSNVQQNILANKALSDNLLGYIQPFYKKDYYINEM